MLRQSIWRRLSYPNFTSFLSFFQVPFGTGIHLGLLGYAFRLCTRSCQGCVTPLCGCVLDRTLVRSLFYSQADLSISVASANFYNPQICSLKYIFFFVLRLTLCVIVSKYFPSIPCLFFSLRNICAGKSFSCSYPAALGSSAF